MVDVRALERVLVAPGFVEIFRLEESSETSVRSVEEFTGLIFLKEFSPSVAALLILLHIYVFAHARCHPRYGKIVVGILQSSRYGSRESSEALVVEIIHGNVSKPFPGIKATTAVATPICNESVHIMNEETLNTDQMAPLRHL